MDVADIVKRNISFYRNCSINKHNNLMNDQEVWQINKISFVQ